ncbi:hypothetical protein JIG36_12995 [Actinoplanes sp. LDG1-06]|uniref:DUF4878 domain-containing protein n=1 Tax=Paractinoplanes ovalisporus TaxID=2810368 RepID=A0ABS2AB17_9ACTN|nr:hypothetical protein [Actinoplanes ovalisporus]MBM2616474.1 hypothetical protein [Actinoplanes ovalisporus]
MSPLPTHGMSPVPLPPPYRRSPASVAAVVGILAVLAVCAVPVFGFLVYWFAGPDLDEPKNAAAAYLQQIEARADRNAYGMLCSDLRAETTPAEFTAMLDAAPRPARHSVGRAVFLNEPGTSAGITVLLTNPTGASRALDLYLTSDKSGWHICGDTLI